MARSLRLPFDGFALAMLATLAVATLLPATGVAASIAGWGTKVAIAGLFFLYGAGLSPSEARRGLRHWRLHGTVLSVTFVVFPLLGLAMQFASPGLLTQQLAQGVLFLCLVPSTVQSSIAFTSIARGNVAGAIVSASVSNMLGVFITPLLVIALMRTGSGASVNASAIGAIIVQLLIPFVVGQLLHARVGQWLERHARPTKFAERGTILLVIYVAFSEGMVEHIWSQLGWGQVGVLVAVCAVLLAVVFGFTAWLGHRLGFDRADRIALLFCGSKKSLASGLPMASVLVAGPSIGMIVLPLMIFQQLQLFVAAVLAPRLARRAPVIFHRAARRVSDAGLVTQADDDGPRTAA